MQHLAFDTQSRVLMGPGPSDVPPSVMRAMIRPTVGHLDPAFVSLMEEVKAMMRTVFGTTNEMTLPISATGSAGMETCFANLVAPDDRVLIGVNGVFGGRMAEMARRYGAEVHVVEAPWGRAIDLDDVRREALASSYQVIALVHAETSTGVWQSLEGLREIANESGAVTLVDAVTSLAGSHVAVDANGLDAVYSGTQKCLSCPPGLSPVTFSPRALELAKRSPCRSWYFDLALLEGYWGTDRTYHHTAPVHMVYALHESLRLVIEEGLDARAERHLKLGRALQTGLEAMGLELPVPEGERLPQLSLVKIPDGADDKQTRKELLTRYGLEIGGGLGAFAGKAWRIGLMGASCTERHVLLCLAALSDSLTAQGVKLSGDGVSAARSAL